MLCTPKPNGFPDHYPVLNGYFIGNIPNIFRQTHLENIWKKRQKKIIIFGIRRNMVQIYLSQTFSVAI